MDWNKFIIGNLFNKLLSDESVELFMSTLY